MNTRAIALTGGIACGKSEVAGILKSGGIPVIDTDAVAHSLLQPGQPVFEKVKNVFGNKCESPEGGIDRKKLGAIVFSDPEARGQLNAIMHPVIYEKVRDWLADQAKPHAVAMIPLLYETGVAKDFEKVLVVASDEEHALRRMHARGWTDAEARARVAAQWPVAEKVRRADAVIYNNDDLEALKGETWKAWKKITEGT